MRKATARAFDDDLLVYGNRKSDLYIWDITTAAKRDAAIRALFTLLDDDWQVYGDLAEPLAWDAAETNQRVWYRQAKAGDVDAMADLLTARRQHEYETWHTETLIDATKKEH